MAASLQALHETKATTSSAENASLYARAVAPSLELPWHEDVVALRRDFHEHPELGFEETRTSGIVAQRLRALGLEVTEGLGVTGVKGVLRGTAPDAQNGPIILVRADMDALPIDEQNDWEWKSQTRGKMHACGHDAHTAIGLTVARLLSAERETLRGTIVFMFQPAEEGGGGAGRMIADGLLDDPQPDFAFGLHVWSDIETGQVALASGPVMASADQFQARIFGRGGHGALPHQTVDPIVVSAQLVLALQTIVAREMNPLQPAVVTIGSLHSGTVFNVIPDEAQLEGTVRAFDSATRDLLEKRVTEIIQTLPTVFGARGTCFYERGYPATINDERATDIARDGICEAIGNENVIEWTPTMGAEDMSMVLEKVPGCYFFVGCRNESVGAHYPHHHPKFNLDETALEIGVRAMIGAVQNALKS